MIVLGVIQIVIDQFFYDLWKDFMNIASASADIKGRPFLCRVRTFCASRTFCAKPPGSGHSASHLRTKNPDPAWHPGP